MFALTRFFVQLAALRQAPQDLPASTVLLVLLAVFSVLIGTLNGSAIFGGPRAALGANLLDLLLTMLMLYALLQIRGVLARWLQTATAFFGLGVLVGAVMLLIRVPAELLGLAELAKLFELLLAIWLHIALGHVLKHALDIPLLAGVMIMLSYTVLAFNLVARVFPPLIPS